MQYIPITIKVVSSIPARGDVYMIHHLVTKFVNDWFSQSTSVFTTHKTDSNDITVVESGVKQHVPNPKPFFTVLHIQKMYIFIFLDT